MRAPLQTVLIAAVLPALLLAPRLQAQTRRRAQPGFPPSSSPPIPESCPSSTSPVATSVAQATDYVELTRTACAAGNCPAYTVRVTGDGTVSWQGVTGVVVTGHATATIDPNDARTLMQRLADRGFWGLCASYNAPRPDSSHPGQPPPTPTNPAFTTTLSIGGRTRRVEDYDAGAPSYLRALDLDIDTTANTHPWRHGGPQEERFADDNAVVDAVMPKSGVTLLMKVAALQTSLRPTRIPYGTVTAEVQTAELPKMLQDTSLNVSQADSSDWDALMYAAQAGTADAVRLLLDAGADPTRRSNEGETALFAAVSSPYSAREKATLLLARRAEADARDHHGVTPLMIAAENPTTAPVHLLLQYGADAARQDDLGRDAVAYCTVPQPNVTDQQMIHACAELVQSKAAQAHKP